MYMEEKTGSRMNHARIDQAMATKPEAIAVACPFCLTMVKDGLRETGRDDGVAALDIAEIIAGRLQAPAAETAEAAAE